MSENNSPPEFTPLYPVALQVAGRRCVVVGGGTVGQRKVQALKEAGASVVVVAPGVSPAVELWAAAGEIEWLALPFLPEHLDGAWLAIAATDQPTVNETVRQAAQEKGILLNLAAPVEEAGEAGDFTTMAAVRRGELIIAIATGGAGPALSARLRRQLDETFGPEWGEYTRLLGRLRRRARVLIPDAGRRAAVLRLLVERIESLTPDAMQAPDLDQLLQQAVEPAEQDTGNRRRNSAVRSVVDSADEN